MKQHMQELRFRMHSTAAAVDDSQRLRNRLIEALTQLLSQKTVSGILHICATIGKYITHSIGFRGIWPRFVDVTCSGIVESSLLTHDCCNLEMKCSLSHVFCA